MTQRHHAWLLWLGLALASSPALASLARGLRDEPTHRYTLLAALLLVLLIARGTAATETAERRRGPGGFLVLLGSAAQLLGAAAASGFIAHVGLATSILGLGLYLGRPAASTLILAFGLIPVPGFLYAMGSPVVESLLGEAAARILGAVGLPVEAGGPLLQSGSGRFEIVATDAGLVTALCAAQVAWYSSRRQTEPVAVGLRRVAWAVSAAVVLQPLLVVLATTSLPLGHPGIGRFVLSHGVPIALAAFVLAREVRGA